MVALSVMGLAACSTSDIAGPDLVEHAPRAATRSVICDPQRLACFDANMELVRPTGVAVSVVGTSQDLPTPGYANRWHYVLSSNAALVLAPYVGQVTETEICGAAVVYPPQGSKAQGGMWMAAEGYWRLDMHPTNDAVAARFAELAGANECRHQRFTVQVLATGEYEILIEEEAGAYTEARMEGALN
jgi:hypothetical protein